MASLGNDLVKSINSRTDAEKQFRYGTSYFSHPLVQYMCCSNSCPLMNRVSHLSNLYRPWWDKLEDYLLYGLVMIGLITLPNSFVLGKNLECTLCKDDFCDGLNFENDENEVFMVIW